jgi:hypothetical protein
MGIADKRIHLSYDRSEEMITREGGEEASATEDV